VNASARAFVGTGGSVLIPGFVVAGSGSVRLLIRAVGPTLGSYGVTDALTDPTISLYNGATLIATNDNWSSALNATEVAAATSGVGAFALANASKDSALIANLGAGSYSAVVSGVGGATGTALFELYVVPAPTGFAVTDVTAAPAVPNFADKVWVTAKAQPDAGGSVAGLRLSYTVGTTAGSLARRAGHVGRRPARRRRGGRRSVRRGDPGPGGRHDGQLFGDCDQRRGRHDHFLPDNLMSFRAAWRLRRSPTRASLASRHRNSSASLPTKA
jgi:hypothetical protein